MDKQINYIGLIAGILTLLLIAVSFVVPWWQFSVGSPALAQAQFSPVNINFSLFGTLFTIPIIWALNIATFLILLAGGLALLVYSVFPNKSYAEQLLGFGYKKPLYALILFVIELAILYFSVSSLTGFSFPIVGSKNVQVPAQLLPGNTNVTVAVSGEFLWPFYLSIAVVAFCISSRVYHKKTQMPILTQKIPTNTV